VNKPALVLDTDAVLAYASGSLQIGERISRAADAEDFVLVPALCLAEAYRRADGESLRYLDVLASLAATVVTPVEPDDVPVLGSHARKLGSKHLAQAVMAAAAYAITPIMTSRRDLVTQVLPKEWPIIEVSVGSRADQQPEVPPA
jgi:hypothetical protein